MSNKDRNTNKEPFISQELRPRVVPKLDSVDPLDPGSSQKEIKRQALEILGLSEAEWLAQRPDPDPEAFLDNAFSRNPSVTWNTLDSETVLLHIETSLYYTINHSGTVLWELFDPNRTLRELLEAVCARFEVRPELARRDLLAFTHQLRAQNLVEIID